MSRLNREDIDRKTNKPNPRITEGLTPDELLNRSMQTRRDDDVIRTAQRTLYDIDYAIKWYIDNEIRPQVTTKTETIPVPVIFANGEKWDNVRRLGYLRDEKGMLQSPIIMLKRGSVVERDMMKTLDVNRNPDANYIIQRPKYNARNRYEDELFPIPTNTPQQSEQIYIINIPKYVTVEYEMMLWCDFTTQMNELTDQLLPFNRFSWGNEKNKFPTSMGQFTYETVNTVGEDRLVRGNVPLTVLGTLLSAHESRVSTIKKMFSVKKLTFATTITVVQDLFSTTAVPTPILRAVAAGQDVQVTGATNATLNPATMQYLTNLTDQTAEWVNSNAVSVNAAAAINPVTGFAATKNEFNVYINGQYIDKLVYEWTPTTSGIQNIVFDTDILGYAIDSTDTIIINGRWA